MTIQKKLVMYFMLCTLIPLMIVFWSGVIFIQNSTETKIVKNYLDIQTSFIDNIEQGLFERMQNLKTWSNLSVMEEIIVDDADGNISNILEKFKKNYRDFLELVMVNSSGIVKAASNGKYINQNLINDNGFKTNFTKNTLAVVDVYYSSFFEDYIILMTIPVYSGTEKVGTLAAAIDWKNTFHRNDRVDLIGKEGEKNQSIDAYMCLYNKDNVLISCPEFLRSNDAILFKKNEEKKIIEKLKNKTGKIIEENKISVFKKADGHRSGNEELSSLGWYALIDISKNLAFEELNRMKIIMYIFIILITIFVLIISYYISNSFTKPIIKITNIGDKLAKGDLNIEKIENGRNDELGKLSEAVNCIIESQKNLMEQANAISSDELNNPALDKEIAGDLGKAFSNMKLNLRNLAEQANIIASDDLENEKLSTDSKGTLGKAFSDMIIKLRNLTEQAHTIASDDLYNSKIPEKAEGTLGLAFARMTRKLRFFSELANLIADGNLSSSKLKLEKRGVLGSAFYEMINNLKKISLQAEAIAENKLNDPILNEKVKGELGESFSKMTGNLKNLISNLENIISQVKIVAKSIDSVTSTVISTSQEFIDSSKKQALLTSDTDTALTEFSSSVQEISLNCEKSKEISNSTIKQVKEGIRIMNNVTGGMEKISDSIKSTAYKLQELNDSSRKISQIVDIITSISEKTALLALNAAIEAARAGESGRGFAVVADEVNKLAEQTNKSVKEISLLVETIKTQTEMSVESMNQGTELVNAGVNNVEIASKSFTGINNAISETNVSVIEIAEAIKEQTGVIDSIVQTSFKLKEISNSILGKSQGLKNKGDELGSNASKLVEVLHSAE